MDRLKARASALLQTEEPALMAGDYNVIPQPEDAANPQIWIKDALFLPQTRQKFYEILNLGYTDALRAVTQEPGIYTFWDYQAGAWKKNNGIRIDHFLLTPQCADLLLDCQIDKEIREREKPSDHVPIWIELDL